MIVVEEEVQLPPGISDRYCLNREECPCHRCRVSRGDVAWMTLAEIEATRRVTCADCGCELGRVGGYFGMGLCGPCCVVEGNKCADEKGECW